LNVEFTASIIINGADLKAAKERERGSGSGGHRRQERDTNTMARNKFSESEGSWQI
jgi:hypothetical protein